MFHDQINASRILQGGGKLHDERMPGLSEHIDSIHNLLPCLARADSVLLNALDSVQFVSFAWQDTRQYLVHTATHEQHF